MVYVFHALQQQRITVIVMKTCALMSVVCFAQSRQVFFEVH